MSVGPGSETKIEKYGVELLIGAAGQNGNNAKGGDGYSGGGFEQSWNRNTGKDGGSGGSDGHSSGGIL